MGANTDKASAVTRAWSLQPEEWTVLIFSCESLIVECIAQNGNTHLVVGAEQIFLHRGGEPEYALIIQTGDEDRVQFILTRQTYETVYHLAKAFVNAVSPFSSTVCQNALLTESTAESFILLALETVPDEAQCDAHLPTEFVPTWHVQR